MGLLQNWLRKLKQERQDRKFDEEIQKLIDNEREENADLRFKEEYRKEKIKTFLE